MDVEKDILASACVPDVVRAWYMPAFRIGWAILPRCFKE